MRDLPASVLQTSIAWAKAEMLSSSVFVLLGLAFLCASFGFWHLGKTDIARAYVIPMAVAGVLLLAIGLGIFIQSFGRVTSFAEAFDKDAMGFLEAETQRATRVLRDYQIAVFRVIPALIALCAVLFVMLEGPNWRASLVSAIAMLAVILIVDTNASARLEAYRVKLHEAANSLK